MYWFLPLPSTFPSYDPKIAPESISQRCKVTYYQVRWNIMLRKDSNMHRIYIPQPENDWNYSLRMWSDSLNTTAEIIYIDMRGGEEYTGH